MEILAAWDSPCSLLHQRRTEHAHRFAQPSARSYEYAYSSATILAAPALLKDQVRCSWRDQIVNERTTA
jgi:hypothetical protein